MKILISYSYYETDIAKYNLDFFIKKGIINDPNILYVFVINGFNCSINIPVLDNVKIIKRENTGYDFGAHYAALESEKDNSSIYDYYIFLNSGVFGPILPHYLSGYKWYMPFINKINTSVKLVGTSIVCLPESDAGGYGPKVEGFFFVTDSIGLNLLLQDGNVFKIHENKYSAIVYGEYGLSNIILNSGYSIDCMLHKYQDINWLDKSNWTCNNNQHPSRKNSFYGKSINPYEVIFHKWKWIYNNDSIHYDIIEEYVNNTR